MSLIPNVGQRFCCSTAQCQADAILLLCHIPSQNLSQNLIRIVLIVPNHKASVSLHQPSEAPRLAYILHSNSTENPLPGTQSMCNHTHRQMRAKNTDQNYIFPTLAIRHVLQTPRAARYLGDAEIYLIDLRWNNWGWGGVFLLVEHFTHKKKDVFKQSSEDYRLRLKSDQNCVSPKRFFMLCPCKHTLPIYELED